MIELQDGMFLYHGSYISILEIDHNRCFVSQLQKYMEHFLIMTSVFGERVRTTF